MIIPLLKKLYTYELLFYTFDLMGLLYEIFDLSL